MSRKSRFNKGSHLVHKWKLTDDRSGHILSSDDFIVDHRGRITSRENFDPIHYTELPQHFTTPTPLPITRSEPPDNLYVTGGDPYAYMPTTYLDRFYVQPQPPVIVELDAVVQNVGTKWNSDTDQWNTSTFIWHSFPPTSGIDFKANFIPQANFGMTSLTQDKMINDIPINTSTRTKQYGDSYDYWENTDDTNDPDYIGPQPERIPG